MAGPRFFQGPNDADEEQDLNNHETADEGGYVADDDNEKEPIKAKLANKNGTQTFIPTINLTRPFPPEKHASLITLLKHSLIGNAFGSSSVKPNTLFIIHSFPTPPPPPKKR